MKCPTHGCTLRKLGLSLVCPRCAHKVHQPNKAWVPKLHWHTSFPVDYGWSAWTTTDATISGNTVSITDEKTEATLISPQFTNLTRSSTQLRDFTKIAIESVTAAATVGKIHFYASNNGGATWTLIKDNGHTWNLNYGNETFGGGKKQTKYSDLRLKIQLWRRLNTDVSPTISSLKIKYNNIPDDYRKVA